MRAFELYPFYRCTIQPKEKQANVPGTLCSCSGVQIQERAKPVCFIKNGGITSAVIPTFYNVLLWYYSAITNSSSKSGAVGKMTKGII